MTDAHLHLLRGDDAFSIELRVKSITRSLGADFDPAMNTTRLDGKTASFDDIQMAVSTCLFLAAAGW